MLILTRRIGEILRVGDDVKLTILDVKGSQARIGVQAPKEVEVHREEIYRRIQKERQQGMTGRLAKQPPSMQPQAPETD